MVRMLHCFCCLSSCVCSVRYAGVLRVPRLRSGDVGRLDEEGYLYILDRYCTRVVPASVWGAVLTVPMPVIVSREVCLHALVVGH